MNGSGNITYEMLLGVSAQIDPVEYRKRFKAGTKNAEGIPLHIEDEAEERGRKLADAYERLYDDRKAALNERGISFSQLIRGDDDQIVACNFAACLALTGFVQVLEQGDGQTYAVIVLHWMRASEDKEWAFSHLCEAVHAYYASSGLREQLGPDAEYPFDDMRDYLREALYQYNHRHC